jgi:hypothetical protein
MFFRPQLFRIFRNGLVRSGLAAILALLSVSNLRAQSTDLTGIAHVTLRVNDLQKSHDFYKTLGFVEAFSFTDDGKVSVSYVKVNDRQFIELIPRSSDSQPGGICTHASKWPTSNLCIRPMWQPDCNPPNRKRDVPVMSCFPCMARTSSSSSTRSICQVHCTPRTMASIFYRAGFQYICSRPRPR